MLRTTSTADLRTKIKRVLKEVVYGPAQYVVEKLAELTAAIILEDSRLLQALKQQQAASTLRETLTDIRALNPNLNLGGAERLAVRDQDPEKVVTRV